MEALRVSFLTFCFYSFKQPVLTGTTLTWIKIPLNSFFFTFNDLSVPPRIEPLNWTQAEHNIHVCPLGVLMASDIVAQLADSLAKTGVEDGELSYKGQGRKLDDAQSGECQETGSHFTPLCFSQLVTIPPVSPLSSGGHGEGDPGLWGFTGSKVGGKHCRCGGSTGDCQGPGDKERVQGLECLLVISLIIFSSYFAVTLSLFWL